MLLYYVFVLSTLITFAAGSWFKKRETRKYIRGIFLQPRLQKAGDLAQKKGNQEISVLLYYIALYRCCVISIELYVMLVVMLLA